MEERKEQERPWRRLEAGAAFSGEPVATSKSAIAGGQAMAEPDRVSSQVGARADTSEERDSRNFAWPRLGSTATEEGMD